MTCHPDQPTPGTPVADLLALLGQLPADQTGQILGLGLAVHRCRPDVPWFLTLPVATHQAAQALADRLGLPRYDNPYPAPDPVTRWSGPWARYQDVQVTHDAWDHYPPRGPQDARALTGHLTRLHQALTALESPHNANDVHQATVTTGGLHLETTATATALALAGHLCPATPGHTITATSPSVPLTSWGAATQDTTIRGPWALTRHHDDD